MTFTVVEDMDEEGVLKVYFWHCYPNDDQKREKGRKIVKTVQKLLPKSKCG